MSDTTNKAEPMVHRQAMHHQLRKTIIAQPWLTSDMEPKYFTTALTQDYTGHITSRADMIARAALDPIFGNAISLNESAYKARTIRFLDSPQEQSQLTDKLKPAMLGSPFKPYHGMYHVQGAATTIAQTLGMSIGRAVESPAAEPTQLSRDVLAKRIHHFFQTREELAFGPTPSYPMTGSAANATSKARADALTDVALSVLAEHTKTIPSFKGYLTTMEKPGSNLEGALTEFLNTKANEYPREMYETKQGLLVADAIGQRYSQDLCTHLKQWVVAEHVTAAAADPKALGTKALANKLAAMDGPAKGQSAA